MSDDYGWCQSCGAVEVNSQHCHKCGGTVIHICVEVELIKQNKRIEELEAELDWIPVSEEMPEQVEGHWGSKWVLATDGKQAWVCKYNYSAEYWTAPSGDITYWMPVILPKT